jgi:spoIIIJ-associated protein
MDAHDAANRPPADFLAPLENILGQIIGHGGFELSYAIRRAQPPENSPAEPAWVVDFSGPDTGLLLERNGALLDALEYVLLRAVRLREDSSGRIVFDCQDWRRTRAQELRLTAQMAAEQVAAAGTRLELTPMNARERRIIHLALKDHPGVRTLSEGFGPDRRVVIFPASSASPR